MVFNEVWISFSLSELGDLGLVQFIQIFCHMVWHHTRIWLFCFFLVIFRCKLTRNKLKPCKKDHILRTCYLRLLSCWLCGCQRQAIIKWGLHNLWLLNWIKLFELMRLKGSKWQAPVLWRGKGVHSRHSANKCIAFIVHMKCQDRPNHKMKFN